MTTAGQPSSIVTAISSISRSIRSSPRFALALLTGTVAGTSLLAAIAVWSGLAPGPASRRFEAPHVRSLGPPVAQLERIGDLASIRIQIADILVAESDGYRGSWLIKGDALLTCDVSRARVLQVDVSNRTVTLGLPPIRVTSPRVDHGKTKTWSVEKKTWLPWVGSDQGALRDSAMFHAQQLIEAAALAEEHLQAARLRTESLIQRLFETNDWHVQIEWESLPR